MRGYYFITDTGLSAAGLKSDCEKAVACKCGNHTVPQQRSSYANAV